MENLIAVIVGGVIGIAGGLIQVVMMYKNNIRISLLTKREEAYLTYIEALLKIKVDDLEVVHYTKFFPIYHEAEAKLQLYGSDNIKDMDIKLRDCLFECFESGYDVNGMSEMVKNVISAIRDEMNIKKL